MNRADHPRSTETRRSLEELRAEAARIRAEELQRLDLIEEIESEIQVLEREVETLSAERDGLAREYRKLQTSTSWRITAPLRWANEWRGRLGDVIATGFGRLGGARTRVVTGTAGDPERWRPSDEPRERINQLKLRLRDLGFEERPLEELETLVREDGDERMRRLAARELARHHANLRTPDSARQCLELVELVRAGDSNPVRLRTAAILEAECHARLGEPEAAREAIARGETEQGPHPDWALARVNLESEPEGRLRRINEVFRDEGLATLSLREDREGVSDYDRLIADSPPPEPSRIPQAEQPLVTVIVPVYNAEGILPTALDSLLAQTWINLEILVSDDCSTDGTRELVREYASRDSRIHLVEGTFNGGPFVARNNALKEASGKFVTCHDADDWSHPQWLEMQMAEMLAHPDWIGCIARQARMTEDLYVYRRGNYGALTVTHFPSFLFRREPVMARLGYWDCVRFSGDAELIRRTRSAFGEEAVVQLETPPLAFQRQHDASITRDPDFGAEGFYFGARREYFEAQSWHHRTADSLYYPFPQKKRPFAVPRALEVRAGGPDAEVAHYQAVLVADFRRDDVQLERVLAELDAHLAADESVGLVQVHCYDYEPTTHVADAVRERIDGDRVRMIVYGERARCDALIILDPEAFEVRQRYWPELYAADTRMVATTGLMRRDDAVLAACRNHIEEFAGTRGIWHAAGPAARAALVRWRARRNGAGIVLYNEDWIHAFDGLEVGQVLTDTERAADLEAFVEHVRSGRLPRAASVARRLLAMSPGDLFDGRIIPGDQPFVVAEFLNHCYTTEAREYLSRRVRDDFFLKQARRGRWEMALVFHPEPLRRARFSILNHLLARILETADERDEAACTELTAHLLCAYHLAQAGERRAARRRLRRGLKALRKTPAVVAAEQAFLQATEGRHDRARARFSEVLKELLPEEESLRETWGGAFATISDRQAPREIACGDREAGAKTSHEKLFVSGFVYSGSGALYDFLREFPEVSDRVPLELPLVEAPGGLGALMRAAERGRLPDVTDRVRLFAHHLFGWGAAVNWKEAKYLEGARLQSGLPASADREQTARAGALAYARAAETLLRSLIMPDDSPDARSRLAAVANRFLDAMIDSFGVAAEDKVLLDNFVHPDRLDRAGWIDNARFLMVRRDPRSQYVSTFFEHKKFHRDVDRFIEEFRRRENEFQAQLALHGSPEQIQVVQFEALVGSEAFRRQLAADLGLNWERRTAARYFRPEESARNVSNYRNFHRPGDIEKIEHYLAEYLYRKDAADG